MTAPPALLDLNYKSVGRPHECVKAGRIVASGFGGVDLRGLLDQLALDPDLDLVAHDEPAVQHRIEAHVEVLAIDLALPRVADPVAYGGVVELAELDHVQRHGLGDALDSEITGEPVAVLLDRLDFRALEMDGRIFVRLKEI